jgi:hypothetical protein
VKIEIPDFDRFKTEYNEAVQRGLAEYRSDDELVILILQCNLASSKRWQNLFVPIGEYQ